MYSVPPGPGGYLTKYRPRPICSQLREKKYSRPRALSVCTPPPPPPPPPPAAAEAEAVVNDIMSITLSGYYLSVIPTSSHKLTKNTEPSISVFTGKDAVQPSNRRFSSSMHIAPINPAHLSPTLRWIALSSASLPDGPARPAVTQGQRQDTAGHGPAR